MRINFSTTLMNKNNFKNTLSYSKYKIEYYEFYGKNSFGYKIFTILLYS
ncbi:hypothetical protein LEP1GSC026_2078 [Leptospira interrogans str. 2002000623]|uniref:Uncharacterized protein n=2 Tax=Leptospira interrogans TaxID=173 RepID=A0A829D707_LEPIR|nr:hypothetical protein LEP1GSC027_0373 [Leptospira interrogans str. 2002000624]EKQ45423.1 hypothetical protein LEP1GSC026_2078 [Leptospira interrogans str. 2002000623]EMY04629.1 hypothetical protein LEP1GSC029_3021 [Leptospira interrogans str. 2002000626]EMY22919.1 hypothetical protein LEP1GSC115_0679 [Leptospira interrogans serovar Australis str. 200703203]